MRAPVRLFLLTVLITALIGLVTSRQVAEAASAFCNFLNGQIYGPPTAGAGFFYPSPFDIGDMLTVTHTGTAAQVVVEAPQGTAVATIPQGGSTTFTITAGGITSLRIINLTGAGEVGGSIDCRDANASGTTNDPNVEVPFDPGDGRINHHVADRAAPVALYCLYGGIQAIRIDPLTGNGMDAVRVSAEELEAIGRPTEGKIILLQTDWVILSWHAEERFGANAWYADGKPYTMTWVECNDSDNQYLER